jgi:hypothetical protein
VIQGLKEKFFLTEHAENPMKSRYKILCYEK